jgi:phosphatidate cytidylyltransferase
MEDDRAAVTEEPRPASRLPADLKPRLIAGIVLAVLAGGAAWAGSSLFALLVLAIALLMSWEWARVVRGGAIDATLVVHAVSVVMAVALGANGLAALGLSAVLAGTFIVIALELGEHALLSAAGVLYTGLPSVALLWFRGGEPWGLWAILFLFAVVWSTDTVAYASGRLIGGPKLMPMVSPNKTWAGFIGGVAAAALAGSLFHLPTGSSPYILGLIGLGLGVVSQAGDLAESALKRAFGVKDASALIPGHGGFMDRADGIVAAAVVAALLALFLDPEAPAQALLVHPR